MLIRKSIVKKKRILMGIASAFLSSALLLSTASAGDISAYYTSGAVGRSLSVSSSFYVNRDYLAPAGALCRSTQELGEFAGVTIHETSNWSMGANARMHAMYLRDGGRNSEVSWHYSVDSAGAYQSIPETEKAWHAGDKSTGTGNARTIAIEICDYSDDANFDQAMANAEWLAADILYRHGIYSTDNYLHQHHDFSAYGKNCPITIRDTNRWGEFCSKTQMYLNQMTAEKGSFYLDDADCDFTFSGSLPTGFGTTRVDLYSEKDTWIGSAKTVNNTFTYKLDASYYTIGWHKVKFAAVHSNGNSSWTSLAFLVGPPAVTCLDSPSGSGALYGNITLNGWAISHAGVSRVDIYVDDNVWVGSTNDFYQRSDVNTSYNGSGKYKGALNSGFSYTIDTGTLTSGTHVLRVAAVSYDGSAQWAVRTITVGGTLPSYPGSLSETEISVNYQTHIQDIGWQDWVSNSAESGTSGQSKRMESIRVFLNNVDGGIQYCTHVQDIGWMNWASDGNMSGTSGESKRLEAIRIRLTGNAEVLYDIYYRVHAQDTGWMDWAKNGEASGTAGFSYRLEAIQIVLVPKGGAAPGPTDLPFKG